MKEIRVERGAAYKAHEETRRAIQKGGSAVRKVSSTKIVVLKSQRAIADEAWAKLESQLKKS